MGNRITQTFDHRSELQRYQAMGVTHVEVLATAESCPDCVALDRRAFAIEDAIARAILPVTTCSHGDPPGSLHCRCTYIPVIPDDLLDFHSSA